MTHMKFLNYLSNSTLEIYQKSTLVCCTFALSSLRKKVTRTPENRRKNEAPVLQSSSARFRNTVILPTLEKKWLRRTPRNLR